MKKKMEHLNAEEIKEKSTKTISEFKSFIAKGNVIDLAVGVIIGSAFGKIVSSIVDDIIMPVIGVIIGGIDFTNLSIKVGEATITYGTFIQNIIDFLIIAICIFAFVKIIDRITKKKEEVAAEEPPKKDEQIILLEEIRDLLKENKNSKKEKIK